jgi:hypothetical protein
MAADTRTPGHSFTERLCPWPTCRSRDPDDAPGAGADVDERTPLVAGAAPGQPQAVPAMSATAGVRETTTL